MIMNKNDVSYGFISNSDEQTMEFAANFAKTLRGGEFISLIGELGAGKTVFAKGIAKGLNIKQAVTSPTFCLHNIYHGNLTLNHFDFYRINSIDEALIIGVTDYFICDNAVCVCEWASNIATIIPQKRIEILIEKINDNSRRISFNSFYDNRKKPEIVNQKD